MIQSTYEISVVVNQAKSGEVVVTSTVHYRAGDSVDVPPPLSSWDLARILYEVADTWKKEPSRAMSAPRVQVAFKA